MSTHGSCFRLFIPVEHPVLEFPDSSVKGQYATIESLLIATQNNTIRRNYSKAKIDNTKQNGKRELFEERYETVNLILGECSKLIQKEYKTRPDWVGKWIHKESC